VSITYSGAGTLAANAGSTTTLASIALPTTRDTGGLGVMMFINRVFITTPPSVNDGWTQTGTSISITGGTEGTADQGTVQVWVYTRLWDGTETTPTVTHNQGTLDGTYARIFSFSKTLASWETLASATGTDTSGDASLSITASSNPGGTTDDMLVVVGGINGDIGGVVSTETVAWTGATLDTGSTIAGQTSTVGDDIAIFGFARTVTAGTASAAPSLTGTLAGSPTANTRAAAQFLRLRDTNSTTLVIADSSHAHAADGVALTQQHALVVADSTHSLASDQVVLTQADLLTVAESGHSLTSDEVTLTQRVTVYFATTPTRQAYEWGAAGLLKFYQQTEGVTYWKVGSEWLSGNYQEDSIAGASEVYRGGYEYEVSSAKATELEALGFTIRQEFQDE
jgi:hypothetical protein